MISFSSPLRDKATLSLLFLGAALSLSGLLNAVTALVLGIGLSLTIGHNYTTQIRPFTKKLLSLSIIGLGAGMHLDLVLQTGLSGLGYTAFSITTTLIVGLALGCFLKTARDINWLISVGTAICGGSAIAAVAPVMRAQEEHISVALAVIFLLNAVALLLFPFIGHQLDLTQEQFGLWSALAIQDTSSVVGAGLQYGQEALHIGTTVKLARSLWIVPLVFALQAYLHYEYARQMKRNSPSDTKKEGDTKIKPAYPWFILGFLAMAALITYVPALHDAGQLIEKGAHHTLILVMFLIGTGLTRNTIKQVGVKPFIQGIVLWIFISVTSLALIYSGWITAP